MENWIRPTLIQPSLLGRRRRLRSVVGWAILFCWLPFYWLGASAISQDHPTGLDLVRTHCLDCHSGPAAEGELDLGHMLQAVPLVRDLKEWRNVAQRIALGDMPPVEETPLSSGQKQVFAEWFSDRIEGFDYQSIENPGYEPARRLTHIEYQNTIRDLVGVDLANVSRFPQDLSGSSGFDNSSNTLFLQGALFEQYTQSAERVIGALFESGASVERVEARERLLSPGAGIEDAATRAKAVVKRFSDRAFRRPATDAEVDALIGLFQRWFDQGKDFDIALQQTLSAVLVMPQFLLKMETQLESQEPQSIDEYGIANRLSYFLWASMPDSKLFALAAEGKLSDPVVRAEQVARMLKNRRAKSLGYVFAAQWLGFDDVGIRRRQDPIDNPWCTETLMTAMRAESALFFYSLLRDNHPVSRLVDARYTYLNEELARHYRIKGIEGEKMRPVRLKTKVRGGILTHASVLSVTAFPDRTSPVVRGNWVLATILGTPPPEPPPDVGEIAERVLERDDLSFREKVQMHSRDVRCAACHQEMDPIGFSLENYDNFGRWRTRQHGRKIDAKGRLPDGTEFDGPLGLRDVIVSSRMDDLTRQLAEKMLTYALGRQLEYYDEAAIREIVAKTKKNDYQFQSLLNGVIESYPFLHRQLPEANSE
ncbi:MAG: DUF1592 domain-containing protein [Mariniblastus sp.]|nr:DUF1592 domain-containing protein [Mariniblastus sp.]